jgi:hypothetical protein
MESDWMEELLAGLLKCSSPYILSQHMAEKTGAAWLEKIARHFF